MDGYISKTTYLEYLQCPKNAWLKMHKPELHSLFELSEFEKNLSVMGQQVESIATKLFPQGVAIDCKGKEATKATMEHIDKKTPVLFQPTFISGKFLARSDILTYTKKTDSWNLYEIKASNSLEESRDRDFIEDASFQVAIIQQLGINLGSIHIIHLNKEYVRNGELDIKKLFVTEDVTSKVYSRVADTKIKMQEAQKDLLENKEGDLQCNCIYEGRSSHCTTFCHSHSEVPKYSVHDLIRIGLSKYKLRSLIDDGILDLKDIPKQFPLSDKQKNQLDVHLTQTPIINSEAIKEELSKLVYPLYFFDYETYAPAVPLFPGFTPYQQVPFQFSLHVVKDADSESENYEYLHDGAFDPSISIIEELKTLIGSTGSVIVWNKSFEQNINAELAERNPEHKEFLADLNSRIYDLMDIFKNQHYVHAGFKGKCSIKKVLPVLVPELSYSDLEIKEGASASQRWHDMVFGDLLPHEKEKIAKDLIDYCGLDTYAMYRIWKHLVTNNE